MKRKVFCLVLSLVLILTMMPSNFVGLGSITAYAAEGGNERTPSDGLSYWITDSDVKVKRGRCNDIDIVLPREVDGQAVTEIQGDGFKDYTSLNSIYIPDTIVTIGGNAFLNCPYVIFYYEGTLERWNSIAKHDG